MPFFNLSKLTPNQQLIVQGVLTALASAAISALSGTYQYYVAHSTVDFMSLFNFAALLFISLFSKSLYSFIPPHAAQTISALQDSYNEISKALQAVQQTQQAQTASVQQVAQQVQVQSSVVANVAQAVQQVTQAAPSSIAAPTANGQPSTQNSAPAQPTIATPLVHINNYGVSPALTSVTTPTPTPTLSPYTTIVDTSSYIPPQEVPIPQLPPTLTDVVTPSESGIAASTGGTTSNVMQTVTQTVSGASQTQSNATQPVSEDTLPLAAFKASQSL